MEPWKPQHQRDIAVGGVVGGGTWTTSTQSGSALYPTSAMTRAIFPRQVCLGCKADWPCPGAYEEMRQVLQHAKDVMAYVDDGAEALYDWREQELLPILEAGE